ncbi:DNA glycosylase AlkZ-like family protein [Propionibacteriaceae bacterium Y1685]|uniref:DNA glycosylase AlkZ-like family protein n=1 Tax=Microlunatus sp. Y1700 TaxID=3418487 RepID=UPI003B8061B8
MSTPSISWPQALSWRLERQFLSPLGQATATEVIARLGAVLAMDATLAELAVQTRQADPVRGELATAVDQGQVITVFAFRGAVHHLPAADAGDLLALRAAGRQWERKSWVEHYGLTAEMWPEFRAAVREAVTDGPRTVGELGQAVTRHRPYRHLAEEFERGAGTLIKPLTWQGDVSFGPPRDGQATFQRLDTNPRFSVSDPEVAGPAALRRHLRAYGPVTPAHLQHWFVDGLSAGRKKVDHWLREIGDELIMVDVEGDSAHVLAEDLDALVAARPSSTVRLLPGHDQWVMGPGTSDPHVTPTAHRDLITRKANPVTVGGVVRGTWRAHAGEPVITWFDEQTASTQESEAEVTRVAGLLALHD